MASSTGSKSVKKSPSMGNLVDQQSNAVSDTELRNSIAERFERDHIYTRLGPRAVLALHPFKSIETSSDATIKSIAAADLSKEATAHVAELAWRAYYEMAQTKEDQAIFLHGVQGSGKSFCHDLALKECLALAKRAAKYEPAQRKVVAKLTSQCAKLSTILTAFGSAQVGSSDASRCGKITTLQYDNESKFSGMKVNAFLLDTGRVVEVPSGERTFNIFYYLLAGASAEDKQSWGIDTGKFKILHAHSTNAKADAEAFTQLVDAFKAFKISSRTQTAVFRALSAILHLGSVEFVNNPKKTAEPASVVDTTPLSAAAKLLGIAKSALENHLIYKTKIIEKQEVSAFCDATEAYEQLHALMQTLYQVCFDGLIEQANNRIRNPGTTNSIKIVDLAGHQEAKVNKLWHLASNNLNEYALQKAYNKLFVDDVEAATSEGVKVEGVSNPLGQKILPLLEAAPSVLNQLNVSVTKGRVDDAEWVERMREQHGGNSCFGVKRETVSILYAAGKVAYKTGSFGVHCNVVRRRDFAPLFLGTGDYQRSKNTFLYRNFDATMQPNEQKNVAVSYESIRQEIANITDEAKLWNVLCVKSNNKGQQGFLDEAVLSTQLENYKIFQFARRSALSFSVDVGRGIFLDTICPAVEVENKSAEAAINALTAKLSLGERNGFYVGKSRIFMDATTWRLISAALNKAQLAKLSVTEDDNDTGSVSGSTLMGEESDSGSDSGVSDAESTVSTGSMMTIADPDEGAFKKDGAINEKVVTEKPEEVQVTAQRKLWVRITWALTWWIPTFTIKMAGMKRPDVIMAWREKVALCIIILLISGATLFFITGFPELLCPHQKIYTMGELAQHNDTSASLFIGVRGQVFDWTYQSHYNDDMSVVYPYGGGDASDTFYMVPDDWNECQGASYTDQKTAKARYATISENVPSHNSDTIIGLLSTPTKLSYWKGNVAYSDADVAAAGADSLKYWLMINNNVYEFKYYIGLGGYYYPPSFTDFIKQNSGTDATDAWNSYKISSASASASATDLGYFTSKRQILACMNRIQFVGKHDTRDTPQCKAANGILLGTMILIVAIMVVRFLAALQLTSGTMPEIIDKFVIVQVPCYTEGEESLRKTIESAATLQYNDKYKLLFIIADGMIIGHGNDKPTPRIVLDILGVAPEADDVPALSYLALGEGAKQHNMAKVYSGLYEYSGHLVPYIAVIKCGKPNEKHRPGNRGKRDSQLILMHFFKKVYYKEPMNALELELYHQMANVIGVRAESYEFCLMIDSDTEVMPDSLVKLVAACQNNRKIMGICGETQVSNARDSFTTMIQVYEYYISHHLAKAFESLFGTVTCLPGCFSMYRIRTDEGMNPILAHKGLVDDYCENNVDTLHKKNLFSLGEDRFLTTLMLKHFPHFKTKFLGNSYAKTVVPENWSVLLSQRRRWINSTIHNLWELTRLPGLCGFFLFSMRFVVYADLYATMTMPAAMGYLVYLIYNAVNTSYISTLSLIMICAAYGLQVVIFLIKGKFEHIGWLVFYILAMPLFNVAIPLYSFWHFDDFSWGNTRVVVGETAGKKQIQDLEPFDPTVIELKTWEEHEKAMAAAGKLPGDASTDARTMVQGDGGSVVSFGGNQLAIGGGTPSVIGGRSVIAVPVSIVQGPASASLAGGPGGPLPTDDQIAAEIRRYLSEADLTKTTKKQVREHLSRQFNVNLTSKKQFMNAIIDDVLSSH